MRIENDIDIARLREAFAAPIGETVTEHPAPETIWSAVRGELPPDQVREVVEHTALCADCAEDWRLAAAFEQESGRAAAAAPPRRASVVRRGPWLAAAAAVIALVAVGLNQGLWRQEDPVYREGGRQVVTSQTEASLPRENALLRWSAGPEGSTYDLLVSSEDLEVLASAKDLTAPRYRVPPTAFRDLPARSPILWRVETVLPDGGRRSSPTFRTTIR